MLGYWQALGCESRAGVPLKLRRACATSEASDASEQAPSCCARPRHPCPTCHLPRPTGPASAAAGRPPPACCNQVQDCRLIASQHGQPRLTLLRNAGLDQCTCSARRPAGHTGRQGRCSESWGCALQLARGLGAARSAQPFLGTTVIRPRICMLHRWLRGALCRLVGSLRAQQQQPAAAAAAAGPRRGACAAGLRSSVGAGRGGGGA